LATLILATRFDGLKLDDRDEGTLPSWAEAPWLNAADPSDDSTAALPPFFKEALVRSHGDAASALAEALLARARPSFAVDLRHVSVAEACDRLEALGHEAQPHPWVRGAFETETYLPIEKLPADLRPHLWPMDPGSLAVSWAVGAAPSMRVLDLCAGGGGKARALVAQGITPVMHDASITRLKAALARVPGLSDQCVLGVGEDLGFAPAVFDRILIDAPGSGSGTLRRHPERLRRIQPRDLVEMPRVQRSLLDAAAVALKPGGIGIYVTCSVFAEENQQVVDGLLADSADLMPHPLKDLWGDAVQVEIAPTTHQLQLMPSVHGCDGFFMAAFKRKEP
jgi:16S rRNA (cytosine967-C5)-methyltransferase